MIEQVPVTLVTHEHLINGGLATQGSRLLDVLNNELTGMLLMHDVQIASVQQPAEPCIVLPAAMIRKGLVNLVILRSSEHEAPEKRWFNYVEKQPYHAWLVLPSCRVEGTLRLTRTSQPMMAIFQQREEFLPVTGATVTCANENSEQASVVMVQRSSIGLLYVCDPSEVEMHRESHEWDRCLRSSPVW